MNTEILGGFGSNMAEMIKNERLLPLIKEFLSSDGGVVLNDKYAVMPGFCEVHAHFREPGFSYKETIYTGSRAAARGGYTQVLTMPNLNPVPDDCDNLKAQTDIVKRDAVIEVYPYGAITKGEKGEVLADFEEMDDAIAFSDDGRGVQNAEMMKKAMLKAKSLDKLIVAHCEVNDLLKGGYIHDGEYARTHGHRGICSASEYEQIARDVKLAKETGVKYHVCHISTKESVEIIRQAKSDGVDITCETAPHYLILSDKDLREDGKFKMNPPLRGEDDKQALIQGIIDGTIDCIATDHAPHSEEEKSKGLEKSAFGIVGIETCFALCYTHLVKKGIITLERLVELLSHAPKKRFNIENTKADFTVFEIATPYTINPEEFLSKGKSTPFDGYEVYGRCVLTVNKGKIAYQE